MIDVVQPAVDIWTPARQRREIRRAFGGAFGAWHTRGVGARGYTPNDAVGGRPYAWVRGSHYDDVGGTLTWWDLTGNGRNATQSTASQQPTFAASIAALGNRPGFVFDDSSSERFSWNGVAPIMDSGPRAFTVAMAIAADDTGAGNRAPFGGGSTSDVDPQVLAYIRGAPFDWNARMDDDAAASASFATGTIDTLGHLLLVDCDGSTMRMYLDGVKSADFSVSGLGTLSVSDVRIGSRFKASASSLFWSGSIAEVVAFDRRLSDRDLRDLEDYFAVYYDLPIWDEARYQESATALVFLTPDLGRTGSTPVTALADQSATGNDFAPDGNGPDYVASWTHQRPACLYDDANTEDLSETGGDIATHLTGDDKPIAFMLAAATDDTGSASATMFGAGNSADNNPWQLLGKFSGGYWKYIQRDDGATRADANLSPGTPDSDPHVWGVRRAADGSVTVYLDGAEVASGGQVGTSTFDNASLGAVDSTTGLKWHHSGHIARFVLWDADLTDGEWELAQRRWMRFYGLT